MRQARHHCWTLGAAAALLLAGCQSAPKPEVVAVSAEPEPAEEGWQAVAADEDRAKIEAVAAAWREALDSAGRAGFRRALSGEGPLLDPEAALPRPEPAPGNYLCRVVRLGAETRRAPAFQAFKSFFCHVGVAPDGQLSITKQTGSERPAGYLWPDGNGSNRMVFLGSLALGTEDAPLPYGEDPSRDMAGVFERVAPMRYRLVIPNPRGTAKLDVIELVPAPVQAPE
jgi:hypothetical protein